MEKENIRSKMLQDFNNHKIFAQASEFGKKYIDELDKRHVYPQQADLDKLKTFEEHFPEKSENSLEILALLNTIAGPNTVTTLGGRYFGFVNGSSVPAGLAAKILATYWDQNTAMDVMSPISAKLEMIVEQWIVEIFNLPKTTAVSFVSGTSLATFCGLLSARYRLLKNIGWDVNEKGLFGAPKLRIVTSKQIHSSVHRAINMAGFGKESVEWVDVDAQGRILVDKVPNLDNRTIIVLQAGNVNSGSFDNFQEICSMAQKVGAWVHIDGAFGLWAKVSKNLEYLTHGIELASSWSTDGHKTLNTPYDSGMVMVKDREALISAMDIGGSYLNLVGSRNGMLHTPDGSRRARIIDLWATLKFLGREGLDEMVQGLHDRAKQFASEIVKIDGFTVLNDVVFNQVLVKCQTDELTLATVKKIQELRECWVGSSEWSGQKVIRVSVSSWVTNEEDIHITVESFKRALELAKTN